MILGWLFLIGLGFWVYLQSQRIRGLTEDIERLHKRLEELESRRDEAWDAPPAPANETQPELLLTEVVEDEPPQEATKPEAAKERPVAPEPELVLTQVAPPLPPLPHPQPQPKTSRARDTRRLERWLSENGLAWLGGGALAIGGVLLVAYAAQQAFFTPQRRLLAALIVGVGLIGASEWVRRMTRRRLGHPLVASLLAGAGAATLYAASWAAYGIYGFVSMPVAAAALLACAGILLALSFLHGQSLGALAFTAALVAPLLTSAPFWAEGALSMYLGAVLVAGFGISAFRRWGWAAGTVLIGAYVWFALSLVDTALFRALALLGIAALGGTAVGLRMPREGNADADKNWRAAHAYLPSIALGVSALFVVFGWTFAALYEPARMAGPALAAIYLIGLGALAVRERVVRASAFQATIVAAAIGCFAYLRNTTVALDGTQFYIWALACAGAAALAALAAAPRSGERILVSGFGALGALLMLLFAVMTRPVWAAIDVWGPLLAGAVLFALAAELVARQVRNPSEDWSVDLWAVAAAGALLVALESLAPVTIRPAAIAAAALLFAGAHYVRGWRAAANASLVAATLALVHALAPDFAGEAWSGRLQIGWAVSVVAIAGALQFGAGGLIRRRETRAQIAEALDAAAILSLLFAAFLLLRSIAGGGERLDAFVENALRALMLIAAGFVALPRFGKPAGLIARWRGHVLMSVGLVWAFYAAGLIYNPWWGEAPAHVGGVPLLNANALAFAAPAALAGLTANRLYMRSLEFARAYALAAGVFAVLWVMLELRRAFHGADMALGPAGLIEGNAYGLAMLAMACGVAMHARSRERQSGALERPFTHDLSRATGAIAFAGVLFAAYAMLLARNAWWGMQFPGFTNALTTGVAVLALAPAAALSLLLAHALPRRADNACFTAASGAALFALAFGALAIRWAHHQGAMDDRPAMQGVEGLLYALWPLGFIASAAMVTERFRKRAELQELVRDFEAIWSVAIWPALGFSALGLWAFFNPWRGLWPAHIDGALYALAMLAIYVTAAHVSVRASRLTMLQHDPFISRAAKIAAVLHVFAAVTLAVRYLFHGASMATMMPQESLERWTYSALWALFGAAVLGVGALRGDFILRWTGLVFLLAVTAKVFFQDMAALNGVVRAASFLGLGLVLIAVALATRRFGQTAREH